VVGVGAHHSPVSGYQFHSGDLVGGKAMLTPIPGQPASERVAGDGDVRRAAVHGGEAVLGRSRHDVAPQRPADHAGGALERVDADAGQLRKPDKHDVIERAPGERPRVMTGALGSHT
jgi:hypothetical protein